MADPKTWEALPFHFWTVTAFVFGSIVGSFLNVCIHRMPIGESIVSPPSHCPHCRYSIPWYLNIPLFTWLWLGGRCANCKAPISPRYFFSFEIEISQCRFHRIDLLQNALHCVPLS